MTKRQSMLKRRLELCLNGMYNYIPQEDHSILYKYFIKESTIEELAKTYNLKESTINSRIKKASFVFSRRHQISFNIQNLLFEKQSIISEIDYLKRKRKILYDSLEKKTNNLTKSKRIQKNELDLMSIQLNDLDFSIRAYNCIKSYNFHNKENTISNAFEFFNTPMEVFLKMRNFGKSCEREVLLIKESLKKILES